MSRESPQTNADHCEELVRLKLIAEGYDGLFETLISELKDVTLAQRYTFQSLFAVGGQSILWLAEDGAQPTRPVLVRMALLPYHRPAYIRRADIHQARRRIEREAQLLRQFEGTPLPHLYDLIRARNPLHPSERRPDITETEPYLVMELIQGRTLGEWTRVLHQSPRSLRKIALAATTTAHVVADLLVTLYQDGAGYLYTDLNPSNIIVPERRESYARRVLDAGSLIPVNPTPEIEIPLSWDYIPPDYYSDYSAGSWRWPTPGFVAYTLGKTLWHLLTNRQPMPGEHPDLDQLDWLHYPQSLTQFIRELIDGQYPDFASLQEATRQLTQTPSKQTGLKG